MAEARRASSQKKIAAGDYEEGLYRQKTLENHITVSAHEPPYSVEATRLAARSGKCHPPKRCRNYFRADPKPLLQLVIRRSTAGSGEDRILNNGPLKAVKVSSGCQ